MFPGPSYSTASGTRSLCRAATIKPTRAVLCPPGWVSSPGGFPFEGGASEGGGPWGGNQGGGNGMSQHRLPRRGALSLSKGVRSAVYRRLRSGASLLAGVPRRRRGKQWSVAARSRSDSCPGGRGAISAGFGDEFCRYRAAFAEIVTRPEGNAGMGRCRCGSRLRGQGLASSVTGIPGALDGLRDGG